MTNTELCDTERLNVLRDALIDALRTGRESVCNYAAMLIECDLHRWLPIGRIALKEEKPEYELAPAEETRLLIAAILDVSAARSRQTRRKKPAAGVFDPVNILALVSRLAAGDASRTAIAAAANLAQEQTPAPGSPEAIARARAYVQVRCEQGDGIDRRSIYRWTGWDAPRINRFVAEVQDSLPKDQRAPGRGPARNRG